MIVASAFRPRAAHRPVRRIVQSGPSRPLRRGAVRLEASSGSTGCGGWSRRKIRSRMPATIATMRSAGGCPQNRAASPLHRHRSRAQAWHDDDRFDARGPRQCPGGRAGSCGSWAPTASPISTIGTTGPRFRLPCRSPFWRGRAIRSRALESPAALRYARYRIARQGCGTARRHAAARLGLHPDAAAGLKVRPPSGGIVILPSRE